nr:unnamed protein product [Callosobruchus chinensis]
MNSRTINIDVLSDSVISNNYLNVMSKNKYISMINDFTRTKKQLSNFGPILLIYKITDHYPSILHCLLPDKKTSISESRYDQLR